jgi:hypothetical protein
MNTVEAEKDPAEIAAAFIKEIDSYEPEQMVKAMVTLTAMKGIFKNQELYWQMFQTMTIKLLQKLMKGELQ